MNRREELVSELARLRERAEQIGKELEELVRKEESQGPPSLRVVN